MCAGRFQDCIEVCSSLLDIIPTLAGSGLAATILRRRAQAASARRLHDEALTDLNLAAEIEPGDAATFLARAQVSGTAALSGVSQISHAK